MVSKLSSAAGDRSDKNSLVGPDVLHLITSGMYTNPLTIYREYIQNAADAIASFNTGDGRVTIALDIGGLCVQIRDNGPGLSYKEVQRELIPISKSRKNRRHDRGFRGIGRLCGLAFGTSVSFLTRRSKNDPVTKVTWDRVSLQNGIDKNLSVEKTILQSTTVEKLKEGDYPPNFFEVQIHGISRYAATTILNKDVVRNYIGETCPVPFGQNFPYAHKVLDLLEKNGEQALEIDIRIGGEDTPITRLHEENVVFGGDRLDKFADFEEIKVPGLNSSDHSAIGWVAHTSHLGAIPAKAGIRCLRVRHGNIQVGDETAFDHLFSEARFNRWCVAEVHILDSHIIPNGRRDYFEPGVHLRNLENHLSALCRKLEQRVRASSQDRNRRRNFQTFLDAMDEAYKLATSGYLTAKGAQQFADEKIAEIEKYKEKYQYSKYAGNIKDLERREKKFSPSNIRIGRKNLISGIKSSEISIYRRVFDVLAQTSSSSQDARKTIELILKSAELRGKGRQ